MSYCSCQSFLNLDKTKIKLMLNDFNLKYLSVVGKPKLLNICKNFMIFFPALSPKF